MSYASKIEVIRLKEQLKYIADALGTAETGDALIEVARNAHKAEQELASVKKQLKTITEAYNDAARELEG